MMNAEGLLEQLARAKAQIVRLKNMRDEDVIDLLTDEQKPEFESIQDSYTNNTNAVMERIKALESEIKMAVITEGATVKAHGLMAVWNKPRESWDGKGLSGYAVAHPEVLQFRTVGEASVTIREAK